MLIQARNGLYSTGSLSPFRVMPQPLPAIFPARRGRVGKSNRRCGGHPATCALRARQPDGAAARRPAASTSSPAATCWSISRRPAQGRASPHRGRRAARRLPAARPHRRASRRPALRDDLGCARRHLPQAGGEKPQERLRHGTERRQRSGAVKPIARLDEHGPRNVGPRTSRTTAPAFRFPAPFRSPRRRRQGPRARAWRGCRAPRPRSSRPTTGAGGMRRARAAAAIRAPGRSAQELELRPIAEQEGLVGRQALDQRQPVGMARGRALRARRPSGRARRVRPTPGRLRSLASIASPTLSPACASM